MASPTLTTSLIFRLIDRVTGPIRRMVRGVGDVEKAGKRASSALELAANMKQSADAVGDFSRQVTSVVQKPIKLFTDFEEQMSKVRALTFKGMASEENKKLFAELATTARKLGADTQFSGMEAAQGMTLLATAGFSAREQIDSMAGVLDIAAASGDTLANSAEISAQTLRGFRLEAKEMARVGDVLANTFTSSQTTLATLGETMKYVAPVAAAAGVSLEKTAAMAGVLGDVGVQGSQAGTTLRAVISRLSAPTGRRAKSALQFLGINPKDKNSNLRPVEELLAQIQQVMDKKFGVGKGGARRAGLVKAIFGEEPEAGVEALLEAAGSGKLRQAIDANMQAAGTAHKIAVDMVNNTAGASKELDSALEELQLTVGERLIPEVVDLLKYAKELTISFTDWAAENPALVKSLGIVLGLVGGFGLVVAPMIKGVAAMITLWGGLSVAWSKIVTLGPLLVKAFQAVRVAALANPITAIVTGVALAALLIYEYWEPISEFFSGLWDSVTAGFKVAIAWIVEKLEWASDKVRQIKDTILLRETYDSAAAAAQQGQLAGMSAEQLRQLQAMGGGVGELAGDALKQQRQLAESANKVVASIGPTPTWLSNLGAANGPPAASGEPMIKGEAPSTSKFDGELKITVTSDGQVAKQQLKTRGDPGFRVRANVGRQAG